MAKGKMDNNRNNYEDIDYTLVLDENYRGPFMAVELEDKPIEANTQREPDEGRAAADRLYDEYEKMCLKDFTALDTDDIYPHTYQWRVGDRYDEAKLAVLEAAVKQGKRIADTEEYLEYTEKVKKTRFEPDSWE